MIFRGNVDDPQALGRLLQQSRLIMGLTQEELGQKLDISQGYVSELEGGISSLALKRTFEFMRLTGMTLTAELPQSENSHD
jgi:HTH-type transcriptional regulator/antitoxin HipB